MEQTENKYIEVAYDLYIPNETENGWELVEKTSKGNPFQFISGLGFTLDAFEREINDLKEGDNFDFVVPVEEAYGEYTEEHVLELAKEIFCVNGKFDETRIFPGNVVPLTNAEGNRFDGIVQEVRNDVVVIDLNHPLAGKPLHFKGSIVASHIATTAEIQVFVNKMTNEEDCECCGHHHEDGCCGHHHEDGCCGHHHGDNCCGHHHEH